MESVVSAIKTVLATWYQITVANPEYCLAVATISSIVLGALMSIVHRHQMRKVSGEFTAQKLFYEEDRLKTNYVNQLHLQLTSYLSYQASFHHEIMDQYH